MNFASAPSLLAAALLTAAAGPARAQNRVANYGYGQPGTADYEHFSFWTNNGRRSDIHYAHGKDRVDNPLRYGGASRVQGQAGFKVRFENGRILYVVPSGTGLLVSPSLTAAPKTFAWEYEGPVNGVGTVCSVCVADATAAAALLRRHYVQ